MAGNYQCHVKLLLHQPTYGRVICFYSLLPLYLCLGYPRLASQELDFYHFNNGVWSDRNGIPVYLHATQAIPLREHHTQFPLPGIGYHLRICSHGLVSKLCILVCSSLPLLHGCFKIDIFSEILSCVARMALLLMPMGAAVCSMLTSLCCVSAVGIQLYQNKPQVCSIHYLLVILGVYQLNGIKAGTPV